MIAALVLAGCGRGGGDATVSDARDRSDVPTFAAPATTTTAVPSVVAPVTPSPTTTAAGSAAPTTRPPTSPASTGVPPPAPTSGGSNPAAPLRPAAPGTYRYDTSGVAQLGGATVPFPALTTLTVDPPAGDRQHATRDLRDPSRNGPVIESVFDYRSDGVYLTSMKLSVTFLLFAQAEELRPPAPVLLLPTGARPGLHRELDVPTPQSSAHLVLDVVGEERLTIGGQGVDTLVVRLVATLAGALGAKLELTVWVAPASGVWVKERFVADAASPDGSVRYHADYNATLQRLSPA